MAAAAVEGGDDGGGGNKSLGLWWQWAVAFPEAVVVAAAVEDCCGGSGGGEWQQCGPKEPQILQISQRFAEQKGTLLHRSVRRPCLILVCKASKFCPAMGTLPPS